MLPEKPSFSQAVDIRVRVFEEAEKLGLLPYAPVEIHVISRKELSRYTRKGKIVRLGC